ncbi:MAG: thioredoxin domain-containing protein [Sulfuricella sp.]|jgi:thioredoxin 1
MATVDLNKENFSDVITGNDIVVVDFWAPWCGPCKSFAPTYEAVSEKIPAVVFAKVNTEVEQEMAHHFQIRSIPTLMIFREQIIIYSEPGALPGPALEDIIAQVQALDMAEVHKQIAAENAK